MIVVDETLNKKWNWWPLFPLYPYGKKKTILKELIFQPEKHLDDGTILEKL